MLHFFLSYARGEADPLVKKFFDDLCKDIRLLAGAEAGEQVGFLDADSVKLGQDWSVEIDKAISTSACFLALASPRYFLTDPCGQEWHAFDTRLDEFEVAHASRPPLLLPLQWVRCEMHPKVQRLQYRAADLGAAYNEHGVWPLIRLPKRFRDDYRAFVMGLATHIVALGDRYQLPPLAPTVRTMELLSAFRDDDDRLSADSTAPSSDVAQGADSRPAEPADDGPGEIATATTTKQVHVVVAAGRYDEMRGLRENLSFYGADRTAWSPYRPEGVDPVGVRASQVAAAYQYHCTVSDIDGLLPLIEEAKRTNSVVVILVDAWATKLKDHRTTLRAYDDLENLTSAVIVPMNNSDNETMANLSPLWAGLNDTLRNAVTRAGNPLFRSDCSTIERFAIVFAQSLKEAQNKVFVHGPVYAKPTPAPVQRPVIEGPSGGAQ